MKIAVTQREIQIENQSGQFIFDGLERCWYNFLPQHQLLPIPNLMQTNFSQFGMDCLLISGGPDCLHRHHTENAAYSWAVEHGIPIVGICHGAFVINDINGGANKFLPGHHGVIHNVTMNNVLYAVNSYHSQAIDSLAPNFEVVAVDQDQNIEAFRHKTLPIYACVWHPERQHDPVLPDCIRNLFIC